MMCEDILSARFKFSHCSVTHMVQCNRYPIPLWRWRNTTEKWCYPLKGIGPISKSRMDWKSLHLSQQPHYQKWNEKSSFQHYSSTCVSSSRGEKVASGLAKADAYEATATCFESQWEAMCRRQLSMLWGVKMKSLLGWQLAPLLQLNKCIIVKFAIMLMPGVLQNHFHFSPNEVSQNWQIMKQKDGGVEGWGKGRREGRDWTYWQSLWRLITKLPEGPLRSARGYSVSLLPFVFFF